DGIVAPKRLFFAGDNMAYIANGQLYVKSGEEFESKGVIGEVKSIVDFNNQKTLFYPCDMEYDYQSGSLTEVNECLQKIAVSDELNFTSSPGNDNFTGAAIKLKGSENDDFFYPGQQTDENGNVIKDANGNTLYNSITINASGLTFKADKDREYGYKTLLVVVGYDEDGNMFSYSGGKVCYFRFDFGTPIQLNGNKIAKFSIYVVYTFAKTIYFCKSDETCIAQRDADVLSDNVKFWMTETKYPASNSRPHIDYACTDNNRVVAVHKNSFYASSLGNYTNWTDFVDADGNPKATGAYAEELNTPGDFNSITKYNTTVILTKNDMVYACYGNKPPYRINEVCKTGCIDGRTIAEVDGYLYWLGRDGIYRFGGGSPRLISHKIGGDFFSGVAVANGLKYYCCLYDGKSYKMYVYNTQYDFWHVEDSVQYVDLVAKDGIVYGLTADGEIVKFDSGDERVSWSFTTIDFDFSTEYTKNVAKVYCRLKLYDQAYVNLYIRSNKQDWYKFASYKADGTNVFQAKAKLKKCDYFTLKVEGVGDAEIMDIYADCLLGSQKHRSSGLSQFRKG
ncbi:MAG: hypothetical protein IJM94_06470, partial [Clostridia bacterium]|nr:hypothetical protein [Clostridia bacterium]